MDFCRRDSSTWVNRCWTFCCICSLIWFVHCMFFGRGRSCIHSRILEIHGGISGGLVFLSFSLIWGACVGLWIRLVFIALPSRIVCRVARRDQLILGFLAWGRGGIQRGFGSYIIVLLRITFSEHFLCFSW